MQHPKQNSCTGMHGVHFATKRKVKTCWIIGRFDHLASSVKQVTAQVHLRTS